MSASPSPGGRARPRDYQHHSHATAVDPKRSVGERNPTSTATRALSRIGSRNLACFLAMASCAARGGLPRAPGNDPQPAAGFESSGVFAPPPVILPPPWRGLRGGSDLRGVAAVSPGVRGMATSARDRNELGRMRRSRRRGQCPSETTSNCPSVQGAKGPRGGEHWGGGRPH
jgi:hypothetical protein